jgi:cytochrome c553
MNILSTAITGLALSLSFITAQVHASQASTTTFGDAKLGEMKAQLQNLSEQDLRDVAAFYSSK